MILVDSLYVNYFMNLASVESKSALDFRGSSVRESGCAPKKLIGLQF